MNAAFVAASCAVVASAGIIIDAAESLATRREIATRFAWPVIRTTLGPLRTAPAAIAVMDAVAAPRGLVGVHLVRSGAAVLSALLLVTGEPKAAAVFAFVVLAAQLLALTRLTYGLDGADQMQTVIWAGIALYGVAPAAGLTLIAGQSLLSYLVAGLAKLAGGEWRSGQAPQRIAATVAHGHRVAARLLGRCSGVAALLVVLFEVGGPLLVLGGPYPAALFVVVAAIFHVVVAAVMGLNNFVWAFIAALPAVWWLSTLVPWV